MVDRQVEFGSIMWRFIGGLIFDVHDYDGGYFFFTTLAGRFVSLL